MEYTIIDDPIDYNDGIDIDALLEYFDQFEIKAKPLRSAFISIEHRYFDIVDYFVNINEPQSKA